MVLILAGYRNLLMLNGVGFIDALREYYRTSSSTTSMQITEYTVQLIDAGYQELDETEIRIYSNYIAKVMNYDEDDFFKVLKKRAGKVIFYENDVEKAAKQQIKAMFHINRELKKINKYG